VRTGANTPVSFMHQYLAIIWIHQISTYQQNDYVYDLNFKTMFL